MDRYVVAVMLETEVRVREVPWEEVDGAMEAHRPVFGLLDVRRGD